MKLQDIARLRLHNQRIATGDFTDPHDLLTWMGAMQAQDYSMAKWAMALRMKEGTDRSIENAIRKGTILRTHVLRPTWHFVPATDIRWMLQLTAPRLQKQLQLTHQKMELDEKTIRKTQQILIRQLEGGKQLTREELIAAINRAKIATDALRASHIMLCAELDGIVCNGARRNKQFTYALLDERVPATRTNYGKEEMQVALALRYFRSHGPATRQDFCWWSGLSMTDVICTLALIKQDLAHEKIEGQTYWFDAAITTVKVKPSAVYLLPAFDEFLISYRSRDVSIPLSQMKLVATKNGIFKPLVVVNGEVKGLWKPVPEKGKTKIEIDLIDAGYQLNKAATRKAAERYGLFLDAAVEL